MMCQVDNKKKISLHKKCQNFKEESGFVSERVLLTLYLDFDILGSSGIFLGKISTPRAN